MRTKNRMDPVVDEHPVYAGYRDVALNLRFRSEEACDLGLDGHVCELRLILMSIADLYQGEDGQARHARYLRYPVTLTLRHRCYTNTATPLLH